MIDWSKLTPYEGDAWKSFEEFCYQVAKTEKKELGIFTPIDDSGGGDGVEFYLTTEHGFQWGWQAKFYHPNKRLKGRKRSIKNSLKRSLEEHPRLEKWFLCTPTNFTTKEIEWFQTLQSKHPSLTIIHWGNSEFNEFLRNPELIGIKNYFFGELELSIDWFRNQVDKQIKNVGNKYIPELHVETNVDQNISYILKNDFFLKQLNNGKTLFRKQISEFYKLSQNLDKTQVVFERDGVKSRLQANASKVIDICEQIMSKLNYIYESCIYGIYNVVESFDWEFYEAEIRTLLEKYGEIINEIRSENIESIDPIENFDRIIKPLTDPFDKIHEIYGNLFDIKSILVSSLGQELNISGTAGIGKTHISCHVCKIKIQKDEPAILLHGKHFIGSQPLERQILSILDIPATYSWSDFLKALQSAAEAHKVNIPFVIDALNEAQNIGTISDEFLGFASEISQYDNIILITTCRTNYLKKIWQKKGPKHNIRAYGFGYDSISEALEKYFSWYKLKCDLTLIPFSHFRNPLFLKIFCESQNRERRVEKEIFLGEQTLLKVFDDYLDICNEYICEKLSRHPSSHLLIDKLEKLSKYFWESEDHYISFNDAVKILDDKELEELDDWPNSISYFVLDEGLLLTRDHLNGEESILFTYNLLGGYLIAKYILKNRTSEEIKKYLKSDEFSSKILDPDLLNRHPLHEDILHCFTLMLPAHFGKHLYQYTDNDYLFNQSVRSFFEMAPDHIDTPQKEIISKLFSIKENRIKLLRSAQHIFFHNSHPLNFHYWDEILSSLSMPERDLSWTEFIRLNYDPYITLLNEHDKKIQEITDYTEPIRERYYLVAKVCRFLLTSTIRELRDRATKTLYLIGRKLPEYYFDLVLHSFLINDPYISERMLAAAYGITMALMFSNDKSERDLEILDKFTIELFSTFFAEDASYSTTHILSRDYALRLTRLVLNTNPNLLPIDDKKILNRPFSDGGIRTWGESEDRDKGNYRDGSAPIHPDFENYTIGSIVQGRSNYDFNHSEYKKVRANIFWRLYNLGYSHDLFKEIDIQINRRNWDLGRTQNGRKIDRYGKKYSWIAFFELAGYRLDNCLLPEMYTEEPRILYADLDPSFPNPPNKYQIIEADYLGDRSISVHEWIERGDTPDLSSIYIVDRVDDEDGPWVLLDGYIVQGDLEINRSCFVFPRGLLVKNSELSRVCALLKQQNLGGRRLPEIYDDHYIYAGEIPWSDVFSHNEFVELSFIVGEEIKKFKEKGAAVLDNGKILAKNEILSYALQNMGEEPDIMSRLKIIDKEIIIERKVNIEEKFEVVVPVRYYSWENYHSIVNNAGRSLVLMKEFSEHLELHNHPQTFDLYDNNNKRASITLKWGDLWPTGHILLYLRQDLLEKYLFDNDLKLVWAMWGEREFRSKNFLKLEDFSKQHKPYKVFQSINDFHALS